MNGETVEFRPDSFERNIALDDVPDWHREPGTGLWEFGKPVTSVELEHDRTPVEVPPEVRELRQQLSSHETPTFFSGPLANVEKVSLTEDGKISLSTKESDFFSYLASAYHFQHDESRNPIRPLAVQATIFSPDGRKIVLERRPESLADFPGKLSVFGGSLKPVEHPQTAMVTILNKKLGLDLSPEQVMPTGLVRENINNIYCVVFSATLNEEQFARGRIVAKEAMRRGERSFYQVSVEETVQSIERMFRGKRELRQWDPNAWYNILYALGAKKLRTTEQLQELIQENRMKLEAQPLSFEYPIQKYLETTDR